MITQETAARIYEAYREIKAGAELLVKVEAEINAPFPNRLKELDWRERFEFGIPMSREGSQRLYAVSPRLAVAVVRAHIADKQRELAEANEQARIELDTK